MIMAMLFKYLDHSSTNNDFLKPLCLEGEGRFIIESVTVPLPIYKVHSTFSKWV